jgi:type IV pilus assembly protein PilA
MVVVLIIGILVAVAVPIFNAAKATAQQRVCWANERTIEGAAQTYRAATGVFPGATPVDSSHVLVAGRYLEYAPVCTAIGSTAFYSLDSSGTVVTPTGCVHGHF